MWAGERALERNIPYLVNVSKVLVAVPGSEYNTMPSWPIEQPHMLG